jgi:hypothetical protein
LDRTRSRLDIPALRTVFGLQARPRRTRKAGPPAQDIVTGKPQYGRSWFQIRFGRLPLKADAKGEHVPRFEATCHSAQDLRRRRSPDHFDQIITVLAGMTGRFATILDCADTGFLPDGLLDELPLPAQAGTARIAGIDPDQAADPGRPVRGARPGPGPGGFTAAAFTATVRHLTRHPGSTTRPAAYDLRTLRGKGLADKPGRTRRHPIPPDAARTIAALLAPRGHVIAPILAGVRSPPMGRKPTNRTAVDRDYQALRIDMQTLFTHVGITALPAAA